MATKAGRAWNDRWTARPQKPQANGSWWTDCDRAEFQRRVAAEAARMARAQTGPRPRTEPDR